MNTPATNPTNRGQNPLIALFNIYHVRKLIASNVPGTRAFRFKQYNPDLIVKFDRDSAYYSHLSVKMLFEDIRSVNSAYQEATESDEQDHPEVGNSGHTIHLLSLTIGADILEAIDQITLRAVNALSSFCDLLAGDEPIKIGQFVGAIDSVMLEITNIEAVVSNSHNRLA